MAIECEPSLYEDMTHLEMTQVNPCYKAFGGQSCCAYTELLKLPQNMTTSEKVEYESVKS